MKYKISKANQNILIMIIVGVVAVLGLAFLLLLVSGNDDRESVAANPNIETTKETKAEETTAATVETEAGTSKEALALYNAKVKTINDPVAVAKLLETMNLETKVAPYKVTLDTKKDMQYMRIKLDKVVTEKARIQFDDKMQQYAQQMLALVEDADEVQWTYKIKADGKNTDVTVSLNAEATTPLVKTDIKSFGKSPKTVQNLLDIQKGAL